MGRERLMTIGILLILIGVQLYCVRTYVVSPKVAQFVRDRISEIDAETDSLQTNQSQRGFLQTGFSGNQIPARNAQFGSSLNPGKPTEFTPPSWLKWASFFAGAVIFLQGATLSRGS